MNTWEIAAEWGGFKRTLEDGGFAEETERQAARELIGAKPFIPERYLKDSGLDRFDTEAELLADRDALLRISAFFSDISISSRTCFDPDGAMGYEVRMLNGDLLGAVLVIDFAATLWHISGMFPLNVRVFTESEDMAGSIGWAIRAVADAVGT